MEYAAQEGHLNVVIVLFKHNANVSLGAFRIARYNKHNNIIKYFIENNILYEPAYLNEKLTLFALNCNHDIRTKFTRKIKEKRMLKQKKVSDVINELRIPNYDTNITNIINEYVPYE